MTFPVYVRVGGWNLHPHLVFEALAYAVGVRLYLWLRRRRGDHVTGRTRWSLAAAAIVGAGVGSRILFWFEDPGATLHHWNDPLFLMSGKTVVGGLVGGIIAVESVKVRMGITCATGDLLAIPLAVGIPIGRIGCFLTGLDDHTYGIATMMPWGVDFGDRIARHPTALYESLFLVGVAAVLGRLASRPLVEGALFKILIISYMAFRLAIDALKPRVSIVLGMSAIQLVCLMTLIAYSRTMHVETRVMRCE